MKRWECQSVIAQVCMHRCQCKWKMKAAVWVCLSVRRKLSVLNCSAAMSRNIPNPQLSGTDSISKASDQPTFKGHTRTLCLNTHTLLFRKAITLSIIVDRCSLEERDWKSSMHSREETEWGSKLWIIIGDVAIPKISTRGNSWICWLDHGGREEKNIIVTLQKIMKQMHYVPSTTLSLDAERGKLKDLLPANQKSFDVE